MVTEGKRVPCIKQGMFHIYIAIPFMDTYTVDMDADTDTDNGSQTNGWPALIECRKLYVVWPWTNGMEKHCENNAHLTVLL